MSAPSERGIFPNIPKATVEGKTPLSEIERPNHITGYLVFTGDGIMINDEVILIYGENWDAGLGTYVRNIHITREKTLPIVIERTGQEICTPDNDQSRIGEYGEVYIGLRRTSRKACYIGERYKLIRRYSDGEMFYFRLESAVPILTVDPIDTGQDIPAYLKEIWERKVRFLASSSSQNPTQPS